MKKNLLILFIPFVVLSGCSVGEGDLNLLCKSKHKKSLGVLGKIIETSEDSVLTFNFKNKRMYRPEFGDYLSSPCEVWTKDLIICQKNEDKNSVSYGQELRIDRTTGQFSYWTPFMNGNYVDNDMYTGVCEVGKGL
jgi:hypothetical protein